MGHWGTCPLGFANARKFCRPNARWLLLLGDHELRNPFATHPVSPWSKILATPLYNHTDVCGVAAFSCRRHCYFGVNKYSGMLRIFESGPN